MSSIMESKVIRSKDIGSFKVQVIEDTNKEYHVIYSCNGQKLEAYEHQYEKDAMQDYQTIVTCMIHIRGCLDGFSADTHKLNLHIQSEG